MLPDSATINSTQGNNFMRPQTMLHIVGENRKRSHWKIKMDLRHPQL